MTGISRRAYARTRGISEAAVRAAVKSGVLASAVLPNGTIDAAKADKLLAAANTRPKPGRTPPVLASARQRRLRAQARDLQDEEHELSLALVNPRWAEHYINGLLDDVIVLIRQWPAKIAPSLLGLTGYEAQRALKDGVDGLLGELHEAFSHPRDLDPDDDAEAPEPDLEAMTPVQLQAHIENLRARILELGRWERQRNVVRTEDVTDAFIETLTISKMLMRAIPGRTDQFVAGAKDVEEVISILNREVDGIAAALHVDLSSLVQGGPR
jgi:hypothetical protein